MPELLPFDDAFARLLSHADTLPGTETIDTMNADGRVLARALVSSLDVPPWDNAQMDGYAVRAADLAANPDSVFPVSQRIPAGHQGQRLQPRTAARIFTGAALPPGADAVVMQEEVEAGLPLHGSDIGPDTTPVEAVLGFAIAKSRRVDGARFAGFPGAEVVLGQLEHGAPRRLTGLVADSNVPVRAHSVIVDEQGDAVGEVTSGTVSPTLGKPIMLAYLPPALSRDDSPLQAKVRDRLIPLQRVKLPFVEKRYKR